MASTSTASGVACKHHPERAASGICMGCRQPMCEECVTKIDGINQCRECLAKVARSSPQTPEKVSSPRAHWLGVGVSLSVLCALAWWMLNVLFSGPQGGS